MKDVINNFTDVNEFDIAWWALAATPADWTQVFYPTSRRVSFISQVLTLEDVDGIEYGAIAEAYREDEHTGMQWVIVRGTVEDLGRVRGTLLEGSCPNTGELNLQEPDPVADWLMGT